MMSRCLSGVNCVFVGYGCSEFLRYNRLPPFVVFLYFFEMVGSRLEGDIDTREQPWKVS